MGYYPAHGKLSLYFRAHTGGGKKGDLWLIPADAEKPADGRLKKRETNSKYLRP